MIKIRRLAGSQQLLDRVCGRFRMRGGSLKEWCRVNGIARQNARAYLLGYRNGFKALEWRWRIVEASYENDPYWKVVRNLRWLINDLEDQISKEVNQPQFKGKNINPMCFPCVRELSWVTDELKRIIRD